MLVVDDDDWNEKLGGLGIDIGAVNIDLNGL